MFRTESIKIHGKVISVERDFLRAMLHKRYPEHASYESESIYEN